MKEKNLATIRAAYDAFAKGDLEAIRAIATPDGAWRTPGQGLLLPEYKGADGVIEYLTELFTLSEGTIKAELVDAFATDDYVLVVQRTTADRHGAHLDMELLLKFEMRDGKVVETTEFVSDPKVLAGFWS